MGLGYLSCRADSSVSTANSQSNQNPNPNFSPSHRQNPIKIQQFDYRDVEVATNGFSDQKLLGKGSHGSVYKAVLRGRHVAVKRPSRSHHQHHNSHLQSPLSNNEVDNEIEILSKIQSPRLVNLVGFTNGSKDRLLVVEFMSNGTLYDVIHTSTKVLNWGRRIRLALQTAKAIDTLHSSNPPVIHRDIKSANVLIDRNFNARLGDFGLALRCHDDDYRLRSTPPAGTMGYLDPCYVTPDNLSTKLDVFSFGILLLEIISGRKAIDVGHSPPSIVDWAIPLIKKGKLSSVYDPRIGPPRDGIVMKQLAVIAAKCVRSCRERRPTMKDVVVWLTGLSKLVPLHSWNGFNNPCMMVENVGRPVELSKSGDGDMNRDRYRDASNNAGLNWFEGVGDGSSRRQVTRNSRRVYSDLGFSSNLMELMAGTDDESELRGEGDDDGVEPKSKFSNRVRPGTMFGSKRFGIKGKSTSQSPACEAKKDDIFHLRRNFSIGGSSMICSKLDDIVPRASFQSQGTTGGS